MAIFNPAGTGHAFGQGLARARPMYHKLPEGPHSALMAIFSPAGTDHAFLSGAGQGRPMSNKLPEGTALGADGERQLRGERVRHRVERLHQRQPPGCQVTAHLPPRERS